MLRGRNSRRPRHGATRRRPWLEPLESRALLTISFGTLTGIGGNSALISGAVALDTAGNAYVTGTYSGSTSLNTTASGQANGSADVLVAKFAPSGQLVWFRHFGNKGIGTSQGQGIAVDPSGNVYVTGSFSGTLDFDPAHPGTHTISTFGRGDLFVAKLDPNGNFGASSYAIQSQGSEGVINEGKAIAVDATGAATIGGVIEKTAKLGSQTLTAGGPQDPFVARISPTGTVVWAKDLSGTSVGQNARVNAVSLDAAGNAYVAGAFTGPLTFSPGNGLVSTNNASGQPTRDAFIAKYTTAGTLVYARGIGGQGPDEADGIAVDPAGDAYVTGRFSGTATFGPAAISTANEQGVFLATVTPTGQPGSFHDLGLSNSVIFGDRPSVAVDAAGNAYLAAAFDGTGNIGGFAVSSTGSSDVLVAKVNLAGTVLDVRTAGGTGDDVPTGIAVNSSGLIATYGRARVPASFGSTPLISNNPSNLFLAYAVQTSPTGGGGGGGGTGPGPGGTGSQKFPAGDFDGDGKTDEAIFDPPTATYYIRYSSGANGGSRVQQFGIANGKNQFVAGDFDGDGKTDETVFDPTTATYYIRYSSSANGGSRVQQFGIANGKCMMVPGDFDGDGKTDECIFDPTTATYYIRYSSGANGGSRVQQFGVPNGKCSMIAGDFDGDGKTDEAVFDPVEAKYYIRYSSGANGGSRVQQFGIPNRNNQFVAGDFDGDGITDETVFDPTEAKYYIRYSSGANGGSRVQQFGIPNGKNSMVPGDFDGDGKTDEAVFDPTEAKYYIRYSSGANGGSRIQQFGIPNGTDVMVPALLPAASTASSGGPITLRSVAVSPASADVNAIDLTPTPLHRRKHRVHDAALQALGGRS